MRLYFIRHGENQANIDRIMSYKIVDYPLTPKGWQQAEYLAAWLADHQIAKVYSSPLQRAFQTAQVVQEQLGLPPVGVLEELRELNVGVLDGKGDPADWEIHDGIIRRWSDGEATATFEEGEDHFSVQKRLRLAVEQIVAENSHLAEKQGIAIVGHGGIFVYGLPWLCHDLSCEQANQGLKNTAVTIVETDGNRFSHLQWGMLEHLPVE